MAEKNSTKVLELQLLVQNIPFSSDNNFIDNLYKHCLNEDGYENL